MPLVPFQLFVKLLWRRKTLELEVEEAMTVETVIAMVKAEEYWAREIDECWLADPNTPPGEPPTVLERDRMLLEYGVTHGYELNFCVYYAGAYPYRLIIIIIIIVVIDLIMLIRVIILGSTS